MIRSLPPPEEPDFDPPLHPSPEKKPRLEQTHNQLHFGNVTNFGKQVLDWYWSRQSEVYIFVETHLDPQKRQQTCQYFTIRGRTAFGTPAQPNEDNTGTHGGILVPGDQSCGLTPLESFTLQGCGFQAFLWQATECTILVAGVYLKMGENIQSETNATIIAKILALIEATTHPYVLLGDWQNSPGSITSTVLPSKFHFEVLAPDHSILSGNVIDYALLHNTLAGTTAIATDWAIPWRPHALLTLHLNIRQPPKSTGKSNISRHCQPHLILISGHGPRINRKLSRSSCTAIHPMLWLKSGQTGFRAPSSTCCRNIRGRPRAKEPTSKLLSNRWFLQKLPPLGKRASQHFGSSSKSDSNWQ